MCLAWTYCRLWGIIATRAPVASYNAEIGCVVWAIHTSSKGIFVNLFCVGNYIFVCIETYLYLYKRKMCRDWLCGQFPHHQRDIPRVLCPTLPYHTLPHLSFSHFSTSLLTQPHSYTFTMLTCVPCYTTSPVFACSPLLLYHYHASFYIVFPIFTLITFGEWSHPQQVTSDTIP